MRKLFSTIVLLLVASGGMALFTGCSSEVSLDLVPLNTLPQTIVDKDTVWKLQADITNSQEKVILDYLKANPSLTEAPRMKGEPALYATSDNHLRFYWLSQLNIENQSFSEVEWLFLEFEGDGFRSFEEGIGFGEESNHQ